MKSRYILTIICAMTGIILSSCDNRIEDDKPVSGLRISLSVDGTSTKATEAATASESKISTADLYMCKADASHSGFCKVDAVLDSDTNTLTADVSDMVGTWLVYVVANCPSWLELDDTDYDSFLTSVSDVKSNLAAIWTSDNFMMFNTYDSTEAGVEVSLDAMTSTYTVHLQRVAVKVVPESDDFIDFAPYHTVVPGSTDTWVISGIRLDGAALLNCVNTFNLLQQKASDKVVTPSSVETYSLTDGYYDVVPASVTFSEPDATTNEFAPLYCLENNSPLYSEFTDEEIKAEALYAITGTKMKGRVTAVIFRAQVSLANGFDSGADLDPLEKDPTNGQWDNTKAGGHIDEPRTFYRYKNSYFADLEILKTTYPTEFTASTYDAATLRGMGVNVYENGHMYYTYYIKDIDNDYSVTRNTCYRLKVNTIASFGDEVPGGSGYVRTDPIDVKEPVLGVSLVIADWDEVVSDKTL